MGENNLCFNHACWGNKTNYMSQPLTIFLFIFFGFLSGILGGLGMGGGTLLIPLLSIFLDVEQKLCQGLNLLSFLVMALFSLIIHYKNGFITLQGLWPIVLFGLIFTVVGAILAGRLPSEILRMSFGVFLCLLATLEFFKVGKEYFKLKKEKISKEKTAKIKKNEKLL